MSALRMPGIQLRTLRVAPGRQCSRKIREREKSTIQSTILCRIVCREQVCRNSETSVGCGGLESVERHLLSCPSSSTPSSCSGISVRPNVPPVC